ncbi:MAG: ABC transporter ATP-binding protein [Alphaproteobacteria bacterium]|nr:ABC transporter ATP-binding protein [Alphaproteobacteria bacterium]
MHIIKNYRKIYPYVRPYLFRALIAMLITIPIGAMDAVIAWVLKPYMDVVMIDKNMNSSILFPALIIVFSLTQSLLNYAATYLNTWVGTKITMDIKRTLFRKLMRSDPSFFDRTSSGDIVFKFNQAADIACGGLLNNLKMFTTRIFSSLSLICVLLWNSWQLSIIALTVLFGALFPLTQLRRKLKDIMKGTVFSGAKIISHYTEAFSGNRVVSSFNLYNYQSDRFSETLHQMFKLIMRMTKKMGFLTPMMHFMVSLGIAGVIWLGSYLISSGQLTAGGFVSFITALLMLYHPIKTIGNNVKSIYMSFTMMDMVFGIIEKIPTIRSKPNAILLEDIKQNIIFENVCFEYEAKRPVLNNINFTVQRGEVVALVGNSGGGKTTIASLLSRFYDVKSGAIKIDGIDIRDLELDSLRDKIAVVFQDNILFAGTIRENILLGKKDATEAEIKQALHNACLDEFISTLPQGLETQIGERGIKLSGGQRQRVAIARAFIKNAPIVILDEATSSLDNKSEEIVQQAIYNLMKDRTVFIIAHRLSTVRNANKIIVVNRGVIAEIGTHDELIQKEGSIYASLYRTQIV